MQSTASITKSSASDMPRKILFIVNPNAGKRISDQIITTIREEFPENMYYQIVIWKDKYHFEEITHLLLTQNYTDAIAVGGDGTVNHVAKTILNTNIRLGIVPIGSGNGLARSLGISMNIREAIKQIAVGNAAKIDSGKVNGIPFFCTSGLGFDAQIGEKFATMTKRGLQGYVKVTITELFKYRSQTYTLHINGQAIKRKAFLITVANAGQYGNDFYIAPEASMLDGQFHVAILKPFHFISVFGLLIKILRKKAHTSRYIETFVCNELTIERVNDGSIHFDGEPEHAGNRIEFKNYPNSLNAIIGKSIRLI